MKKLLIFLWMCTAVMHGAGIKWEKEYATALKQAKALNKPMMFIVSNHNCRFCTQFETTTLKNPKVIQKLNAEYISAIVYVDEDPVFPRQLYVGGTPATWFLKGDGVPMFEPVMGAVDSEGFLKALDIVKKEYGHAPKK